MSFILEFKVGLWNAWIFMLIILLTLPFFICFANRRIIPSQEEKFKTFSKTNKALFCSSKYIIFIATIYSIFLPLKLRTIWFYVGVPIALFGLAGMIVVRVNWANAPLHNRLGKGCIDIPDIPCMEPIFLSFWVQALRQLPGSLCCF